MDMFVMQGPVRLSGSAAVSGSKNATLPILAASLLTDAPLEIHGIPDLVDVRTMAALLETLGVSIRDGSTAPGPTTRSFPATERPRTPLPEAHFPAQRLRPTVDAPLDGGLASDEAAPAATVWRLACLDRTSCVAHYDLVRRMRASICVLGPLLARRGTAYVSLPGGCNIGDRPVDLHLKGLEALGADIRVENGYIVARARRLRGAHISLAGPAGSTVTGTCNVMMAACLARGTTVITSAACEPEVVDLGHCLLRMGARLEGLGTPVLTIEGVDSLHGATHRVISDRIEAATLMIAAAITHGDVRLGQAPVAHLHAVVETLRAIGIGIDTDGDSLHVSPGGTRRGVNCVMTPYPGLPTDVQAQMMALLSVADGTSTLIDRVFPDRSLHVPELVRMGADIRREGALAVVKGVPRLTGASVMASDLRASAALLLAGLAAEGETVIRRVYHLDRGYECLDRKLNALGARIKRIDDASHPVPVHAPAVAIVPHAP